MKFQPQFPVQICDPLIVTLRCLAASNPSILGTSEGTASRPTANNSVIQKSMQSDLPTNEGATSPVDLLADKTAVALSDKAGVPRHGQLAIGAEEV